MYSTQHFTFESVTVNERGEIIARQAHAAEQFIEDLGGGVSLPLLHIPGGMFRMGSRPGQGFEDELPQHAVRVAPFFLGQYAVTQAQWQAVMGRLPPFRGRGPQRPADRLSWMDAVNFCKRLSQKTGRKYRLPGEAEWEYACRAGTSSPFSCGDTITTDLANYVGLHIYRSEAPGIYRHDSTDVGSFPPNPFGLFDMHGNVWEWCADAWHADYTGAPPDGGVWGTQKAEEYVLRGGCWHDPPGLLRCAARLKSKATDGEEYFGLRVACSSI